jgi:fused signal recognition particle receptor
MGDLLYLIVGIAVLGVLLLVGLLARVRAGSRRPRPDERAPRGGTDVITRPPAEPAPDVEVETPVAAPTLERPESTATRMQRLRARLAGAQGGFGRGLLALLSRDRLDEDTWESIEDVLLTADVGVAPSQQVVDRLRTRLRVEGGTQPDPRTVLHEELVELVDPTMDRRLQVSGADGRPGVVLVVGVNGSGKTTTVGKIARILVAEDKSVVLGAADTFRAAAVEQLATWAQRVGVPIVRKEAGADPAAVAFDGAAEAVARGMDVLIVDTAGRLHTRDDLMAELGKVRRVLDKKIPGAPHETLLVLDATTGQNAIRQAEVFTQVAPLTGVILAKLDGTARGGAVISIRDRLGIPVRYVGVGEQADDLEPFDPERFLDALLEDRLER